MKNVIRLGALLVAATLLSSPTYAGGQYAENAGVPNAGDFNAGGLNGGVVNGGFAVPEIDAAGATLAFALMGGIVAIVRERRRRRSR